MAWLAERKFSASSSTNNVKLSVSSEISLPSVVCSAGSSSLSVSLSSRQSAAKLALLKTVSNHVLKQKKRNSLPKACTRRPTGQGPKPRLPLKLVARIIIWFRRKALSHHITNTDKKDDDILPYLKQFSHLIHAHDKTLGDVVFNKSFYKSSRDFVVLNNKALQLLDKKPDLRTPADGRYLCTCLRQLSTFAGYPTVVQEKLAMCAVHQKYGPNRIILRQNHKPAGFYIILTGTVFAFHVDYETNYVLPMMVLSQGGTFGDFEMKENMRRHSTWVSVTEIEVLWITIQDYADIYNLEHVQLLRDPDDDEDEIKETRIQQFVKTLPHFKNWPVDILPRHPTKYTYRLYNRDDVVETHTCRSKFVYFVITGSISVIKRVPLPKTRNLNDIYVGGSRRGLLKPKIVKQLGVYHPSMGSVYRGIKFAYHVGTSQQPEQLPRMSTRDHIALLMFPNLREATSDSVFNTDTYRQRSVKEKSRGTTIFSEDKCDRDDSDSSESDKVPSLAGSPTFAKSGKIRFRKAVEQVSFHRATMESGYTIALKAFGVKSEIRKKIEASMIKPQRLKWATAVTVLKTATRTRSLSQRSRPSVGRKISSVASDSSDVFNRRENTWSFLGPAEIAGPAPIAEEWMSTDGLRLLRSRQPVNSKTIQLMEEAKRDLTTIKAGKEYTNLLVEVVKHGECFGLASLFHLNQPDFMLVAREGAEVLIMERNFYFSNAPQTLKLILQSKLVNGHPRDEELLAGLQHSVDWDFFKHEITNVEVAKRKYRNV